MARKTMLNLPGFKDVDESGGSFHIPSGDYLMKCIGVTPQESKNGNDMFVFKFEGLEKQAKDRQFRLHCTLTDQSLWKLKQTLRALGQEQPDEPSELDPEAVIDVEVIGTVTDNEYEGKINSRLSEIRSADDVVEEEEEEEKPKATASKATATKATATTTKATATKATASKNGSKAKPKLTATEVEDMDEDELHEITESYGLDVNLDSYKTLIRRRNAVIAGLQANNMLEG